MLKRLSKLIGRQAGDVGADGAAQAPPAGEHLISALARLTSAGGAARTLQIDLGAIDAGVLPCVAVLSTGGGLFLQDRIGDGLFLARSARGDETISVESLRGVYFGSVLTLSPDVAQTDEQQDEQLDIGDRSVFRIVLGSVLSSNLYPGIILSATMSNLFGFALPLYSMAIYDRVIPHQAIETLWALTIGIAALLLIDLSCRSIRNRLQEAVGISVSLNIQQALLRRILSNQIAHAPRTPGVVASAIGAIDSMSLLVPTLAVGLMVDLPFVILTLIYVAIVAHWVVIAPILAILAIGAVNAISHFTSRRAHAESAKHAVQRASLIEESVQSLHVVKAIRSEAHIVRRWDSLIDELAFSGHLARSASARAGQVTSVLFQATTVLSLVIGVFTIGDGEMTVGALVASIMLTGRGISPIGAIAVGIVRALSLVEPLGFVSKLANAPTEETGDSSRTTGRIAGAVRFSSVSFSYPNEVRPSLKEVSIDIRPGERIGLIGKIGSGKSTLLQLIPRFYTPDAGGVLIDDHEVRQYDPRELRRHIAYMSQDCELFDGTIRDNIVRGLETVDEDTFREAVRVSGVQDFVSGYPSGYGLVVGTRGRKLSGGERQAVCLARALVRNAPILILDEPTSAMDSQLERRVVEQLRPALQGRTVIIATHRAPILSLVDRVIWLDGGRVASDGNAADVIREATRMSA